MQNLTELIREDMKPALGVTEPGAIAFAVASAKKYTEGKIVNVHVALNSGMYKNAFTCGIPNSERFGNYYAAALGAVAADAEKGLESLADITPEDDEKAAQMVSDGLVEVVMDHVGSEITIDAVVTTENNRCKVMIRDAHTNIVKIEKDGSFINIIGVDDPSFGMSAKDIFDTVSELKTDGYDVLYSLAEILRYVNTVPVEEIAFIEKAYTMNLELLKEGLASDRAVFAKKLYRENGNRIISGDALKTAQLLCNGAIEARVLGLSRPAMSITGSGAHGIIATMPLYAYRHANEDKTDDETLWRATALSYLITMYIKEYSGRLSAFCGCGIAAGTGMACGLAYLQGADGEKHTKVIQNMASGLTGMICDGGNHGCTMKGIVAVDAAFRATDMAMDDICIENIHGINGRTPEATMKYMGMIASPGMTGTEKTIVEIMESKK